MPPGKKPAASLAGSMDFALVAGDFSAPRIAGRFSSAAFPPPFSPLKSFFAMSAKGLAPLLALAFASGVVAAFCRMPAGFGNE